MINKIMLILTPLLLIAVGQSFAKSYVFSHGYIFDQSYVKRISIAQAENILSQPGIFDPFLTWNWGKEKISDNMISRSGDKLLIRSSTKDVLSLCDYVRRDTKSKDGDSQKFVYLRSSDQYHIIGVLFGHDQPAFLLVPRTGSQLYFVDTQ